jgi:hypothetical protein
MTEAQISVVVPAVWLYGKTTCVSSKIYAWKLLNLALSLVNCHTWCVWSFIIYTGHDMELQNQCANAETNNTAADLVGFSSYVKHCSSACCSSCCSLSHHQLYQLISISSLLMQIHWLQFAFFAHWVSAQTVYSCPEALETSAISR